MCDLAKLFKKYQKDKKYSKKYQKDKKYSKNSGGYNNMSPTVITQFVTFFFKSNFRIN